MAYYRACDVTGKRRLLSESTQCLLSFFCFLLHSHKSLMKVLFVIPKCVGCSIVSSRLSLLSQTFATTPSYLGFSQHPWPACTPFHSALEPRRVCYRDCGTTTLLSPTSPVLCPELQAPVEATLSFGVSPDTQLPARHAPTAQPAYQLVSWPGMTLPQRSDPSSPHLLFFADNSFCGRMSWATLTHPAAWLH